MTPGNRRFVRTALAILGLMALATATVWIVLFMFVRPARGDTVDARMFYVIDGDTLALAGERIRLLGIDAPETREARCERERVAGYETKARVVDLLRFGRSVDVRRHGHDQYGRTLAHIVIDGRDLGEQLVREKLALPYRSGAEAKAARLAQWCGDAARLHARDRAAGARTRDRRPPGPPATGCLRFYEEIRDELERTPTSEGAKAGLLAAALDRCRRSTSFGIAPAVV